MGENISRRDFVSGVAVTGGLTAIAGCSEQTNETIGFFAPSSGAVYGGTYGSNSYGGSA